MFKESNESVVERWIENAYWQYFTAETFFFRPNSHLTLLFLRMPTGKKSD